MEGTLDQERRRIFRSVTYPVILVLILWVIHGADLVFDLNLNEYGLYPLEVKGLPGILTSPFLHADLAHLSANSIPLLVLGSFLFYFYREIAWRTLFLLYLITGAWVWVFARGGTAHIGASGVIYGMASFLFFSGMIRRETGLLVITMLVAFLYGGLIWGLFPQLFPNQPISWESHLMGLLAGVVLAVYYRKDGPQRKKYEWEDEEDDNDGGEPGNTPGPWSEPDVTYHPPEQ
ncbi:MAG TPA: rhomboid family intramembrane serine protease [Bacteroidales bacterium]|nr:rhomboid family intramembrane serine protease [Bacteroidales bacterium]